MNTKYMFACVAVLLIAGCGGSGNDVGPPVDDSRPYERIINGYHLVNTTRYNALGNVISVWDRTTNYDQNTLESTFIGYEEDGTVSYTSSSITTYDSEGRLVREEFFTDTESDTTVYEFNDSGLLATSTRDGESAFIMNFVYDESDRLVAKRRQWLIGGELSSVVDYSYTYNSQGLLVSAYEEENGSPDLVTAETFLMSQSTTYQHDNNGRITRRERILTATSPSSEETRISDFTYDENDNVIEENLTTGDGVTRYVLTYELSEEPIFNTWLRRFLYFP